MNASNCIQPMRKNGVKKTAETASASFAIYYTGINFLKKMLSNVRDSPIFSTNSTARCRGKWFLLCKCTGTKRQTIEHITLEEPDEVK
jgi:hypothetical protein